LGRKVDHLPSSNAEVKNSEAIPPLPNTSSWRDAYLIRYKDNFNLLITSLFALERVIPFQKREREKVWGGGVQLETLHFKVGRLSIFEGSQALSACPSGINTFEGE
jgi:hypothetical protein